MGGFVLRVALALVAVATLAAPAHAAFPAANGKLTFERFGQVWSMNPDGSAAVSLAQGGSPRWSPDGKWLTFYRLYSDDDGCRDFPCSEIWTMKADGGAQMMLGDGVEPAWSPYGSHIGFARINQGLWTMDADGSDRTFVSPLIQEHPTWSPDGQRFVGTGYDGDIHVLDLHPLTDHDITNPADDGGPDWSPDGTRIAFHSNRDGDYEIYVMNADGSGVTRVTNSGSADVDPAWSPDGSWIAFVSDRDGNAELYETLADGSAQFRLTNTARAEFDPDWQPRSTIQPYARPGSATPLRVPLVPEYQECTSPNSQHVAPLDTPSCAPTTQRSPLLTMSSSGRGSAFARYDAIVGDSATAADEADIKIAAQLTDVRFASNQGDYSGDVMLTAMLRITDRASRLGAVAATAQDVRFAAATFCLTTPSDLNVGSSCSLSTTVDTLVPDAISEGKRSVITASQIQLWDAGPDGDLNNPATCALDCGTGDEEVFLSQGLFAP